MRILRIHNRYQQRGGEDSVFEAEYALLERHGQEIYRLEFTNDDIPSKPSAIDSLKLTGNTIWSRSARQRIREAVEGFKAEVVHFDNTFPLISPAVYSVISEAGVAVVQTLHNFRLACPNGLFFRDGHPCEDCLGKTPPYPGVVHACYRESRAQTAVVAAMLTTHRLRRTWSRDVDRYIALTNFAKDKFIEGSLPANKIVVKPNFVVSEPPEGQKDDGHFLFVGRLSSEKGIGTLLAAQKMHKQDLHVAGDGPLKEQVLRQASALPSLRALGRLDRDDVRAEMLSARALVFPSEWYEGFPMTLVEAFACGLPVIASRLGSMAEIVEDGVTGLFFEPGQATDLAAKMRWASAHSDEMRRMGLNARREYEAKYTPERNYEMLMDIYEQAIQQSRNR